MSENEESINSIQIVEIPKDTKYWIVRADGGKYTSDFYINNKISLENEDIKLKYVYDNYPRFRRHLIDNLQKTNPKISTHSLSVKARKIHNFVKRIKVGDVVLTPYEKSNKFLIGIVKSDAKVYNSDDLEKIKKKRDETTDKYPISENRLYRDVKWLRVIYRDEIDPSLLYTLRMHQALISIEDNTHHIDKLISPIYIKNGKMVLSIKVDREDGINSDDWEGLYSSFNNLKKSNQKIDIKSNVQSPGNIEFIANVLEYSGPILTVAAILFAKGGTIKVKDVEFTISKLFKSKIDTEKEKEELKSMKLDNKSKELDNEAKELDIANKKLDLNAKETQVKNLIAEEKKELSTPNPLLKVIESSYKEQESLLENKSSEVDNFKSISNKLEIKMTRSENEES